MRNLCSGDLQSPGPAISEPVSAQVPLLVCVGMEPVASHPEEKKKKKKLKTIADVRNLETPIRAMFFSAQLCTKRKVFHKHDMKACTKRI